MAKKAYSGKYTPKNPSKYRGDPTKVVYRSSWELRVFIRCDTDPNILEWASEEVVIPYFFKLDGKVHRYFADLWVKHRKADGKLAHTVYEIKPLKECVPPKQTKGKRKARLVEECITYEKNQAKWKAAHEYCKARGWEFEIIAGTETKEQGLKFQTIKASVMFGDATNV